MKDKTKKIVVMGLATLTILGCATGCGNGYAEKVEGLENRVATSILEDKISFDFKGKEFKDYKLLNIDLEENESKYTVDVNGMVRYNESKAVTLLNLEYVVPASIFEDVKLSKKENILSKVDEIVEWGTPVQIGHVDINDFKVLNTAMNTVLKDTVSGKTLNTNVIYGIKDINLTEDSVNLVINSNTRFVEKVQYTVLVAVGKMMVPQVRYGNDYTNYDQTTQINLALTPEQVEQIKNDQTVIFDLVAQNIANKSSNIVCQTTEVNKIKTPDISNITDIELEL